MQELRGIYSKKWETQKLDYFQPLNPVVKIIKSQK